ncbi:hypothetical protein Desdi_0689 [Desulfitobacterium dichloroeliminans LMG P-21439]|uniref:Uncharacterized protein n=1 Tax=Desulfitobacterium dichloroeliminans (strain LMG P-21439 / DCA1) TaxID=871963 RepID=L0F4V5_DESDL|nr:hypothetical protein [Desulfitobacterium dichloroeliminans]AGA68217.1 hypothetical protein Desdi_0689 [Desulfitobacterium dichloroeliminans LMG P-21439]
MGNYWARFRKIDNHTFRFDTRIYLKEVSNPSDDDLCIGAIVGKNPGSAKPSSNSDNGLQEIALDKDNLLPNVRKIMLKAYRHCNKRIENRSYIQVLNLMYLCDKDLKQAIRRINAFPDQLICECENKEFPFIWYVWGNDDKSLNPFKGRFSKIYATKHFYFDNSAKNVIEKAPSFSDSARHTQGLNHDFVVPYISNLIIMD